MKPCIRCKETKPIDAFYHHKMMADGRLNKCKECCKEVATIRRNEKIEEVRAYDRQRGLLPHRLEANRIRQATEHGKKLLLEARARYKNKYKNRYAARVIFGNAVRDGKVIKQPCHVCGNKDAEGHHPDYDRPLDVIWLCQFHHKETHKMANEIARIEARR